MIRINLLSSKDAELGAGRRQQASVAVLALTTAVLLMVVPFVIQGRRLASLDQQIGEVQEEIQRYEPQVKEVRDLDQLKKDLEAKLRVITDLNDKRVGPAQMLIDLGVAVPESLWLVDLTESASSATLTGMGLDNETIARFMRQLSESGYFYAVDLVETSSSKIRVPAGSGTQEANLTRFIIKATVDFFGRGGKPTDTVDGAPAEGGKGPAA